MQYRNTYIELCLEGACSLFRGLSPEDKEMIDLNHSVASYRKGDPVLREGGKSRGLPCLVSGKAKVFKVGAGGREQIIKLLRPQNFISYAPLFSDKSGNFSVSAIEDSTVVILNKNCITKILKKNAELAIRLMKVIEEDLAYTQSRLISLTQKHVTGRLAESLLLLKELYGLEADGKTLRVTLSREDIAHLSNMTTSNAIRTLSSMASENIIGIEGKRIAVLDAVRLEEISESGQ